MYLSFLPFFKRQFKVSKRIQVNVKHLDISIIRTTRYTHPIYDKTFDKCSTCSTIFYEKREEVFFKQSMNEQEIRIENKSRVLFI